MARLSLRLLGSLRAELDGEPIPFAYDKLRALLAYLAVESHRSHPREALAGLLWPERPDSIARKNLSQAIFHLRRAIADQDAQPPFLLVTHDAIQFNSASDHWLDVVAFDNVAGVYLRSPPTQSNPSVIAQLERALELYRGPFLQSFSIPDSAAFEEWALLQRERLHRQAMDLLCCLTTACEAVGHFERALAHARRQLELDSWREESHQQVMRLLARMGRRSEALAQYQACRRVLAQELGVEPGAETARLYEQVRNGGVGSATVEAQGGGGAEALDSGSPQRLRAPPPPHNLPPDPTPLVGRERELARLAERCADPACRLVTIVGLGGVGKTRLAIQAAREHQVRFRDGVCFVDLAPVGTADLLASTILRALAAPSEGAVAEDDRLLAYLADKQALLVLDNFEHLLDGRDGEPGAGGQGAGVGAQTTKQGTGLLVAILHGAPEVKLLVTSRERLNLREEWLAPLGGLEVPDLAPLPPSPAGRGGIDAPLPWQGGGRGVGGSQELERYGATALFLACVRRLRPEFEPAFDEARHIARICRLLEGMPLGIELAAPWAGKLRLGEIADELAQGLDLLTTTLRDVPPRHRSMRAAFDRSWRLVSAREQSILRQLSVFRGGCTREAAEAVAGATLAELSDLVDSSWLRPDPSGRYGMHELIRQYCGEKLEAEHKVEAGETADQVRDRHCAYYAGTLEAQESQMNWQGSVMTEIGPEVGNLDAAWRWAVGNGDYEMGRVLVMGHYFKAEMEGRFYATVQLLDDAAESLRRRPVGDASRLPRQESGLLLGWVLLVQGALYWHLGRLARGRTCIDEGLAILRGLDSDDRQVELYWLTRDLASRVIEWQGDFEGAARFLQEWLVHLQTRGGRCWPYLPEVGTRFIEANAYMSLGRTLWRMGSYEEAQHLLRRSLELREGLGEQRLRAHGLTLMSCVLRTVGEYDEAERQARAGLALSEAQGDRIGTALGLDALGAALMAADRHGEADAHFEGGLAIARESGKHDLLTRILRRLGGLALARSDLGLAGRLYQQSRASFERLGIVGTSGYAETVIGLGDVALASGDLIGAQAHFREALAARACTAWEKMDAIAGTAQVFAREGDTAQAAELLALVSAHPFTAHATRERVRALLAELESELPADVFATAVARGRSRPLDDVVAEQLGAAQEDPRAFA